MEVIQPASGLEAKVESKLIRGRVKWWNDAKGFGFIIHPDGDVFVHYKDIEQSGYKYLETDQPVEYALAINTRQNDGNSMIAKNVRLLPMGTEVPGMPGTGLESTLKAPDGSELITGTVKWWNDDIGFGFIVHPYGDVFVHYTAIAMPGFRTLSPRQEVEYVLGVNPARNGSNGMMATYVRPVFSPSKKG